ncbi:aminoacyl-tRNA hydrolase [Adlercreutzia sp. ZJ154]|uniref:aminoacyl-tRNA hydrolase n=1 Tax=Adlercreutzia sp. ZJ154 TaxID=2709790 RepID=UPI0013EB5D14|nr:aminoacyl-tRNA hydrolase [Adlercreutzia sp. ZJ154]
MYLLAGLGNPGSDYAHTRHNAGFDTIDLLAEELGANYWKNECGSETAHVKYSGFELILAKPQSFMNTSGGPVSQLMKKYGIEPDHLIVVHDDLDIAPSAIRVKFGGGLAGHNGLRSIAEKLCTRDWYRVRIGIGRPPGRMPVIDWVLSRPKADAAIEFQQGCALGAQALPYLIDHGLADTQSKFN